MKNPLVNVVTRAMTKFFSKNRDSDMDLVSQTLKVKLAQDIIIPKKIHP